MAVQHELQAGDGTNAGLVAAAAVIHDAVGRNAAGRRPCVELRCVLVVHDHKDVVNGRL